MAKDLGEVYLKVSLKGGQVTVQQLDKVDKEVKQMGRTAEQTSGRMQKAFQALAALPGLIGIGIMIAKVRQLLGDAEQLEATTGRLRANLEAQGAPPFVLVQMRELADELERETKIFSSREIMEGMAHAIGTGSDWNDVLRDMGNILGKAVGNQMSLSSVAENYSKALVGNAEGIKQLFREYEGLTTEELQALNIRELMNGKIQIAISAGKEETTALKQLAIQSGNVSEAMGRVVAHGLTPFLELLTPLLASLAKAPGYLQGMAAAGMILIPVITALAFSMNMLQVSMGWIRGVALAITLIGGLGLAYAGASREIDRTAELNEKMSEGFKDMQEKVKEKKWGPGELAMQHQVLNEEIERVNGELEKEQEALKKVAAEGEALRVKAGGWWQGKTAEEIAGEQKVLATKKEIAFLEGQRHAVHVDDLKKRGEIAQALEVDLEFIELKLKKGEIGLEQARDQVAELYKSYKTQEERLKIEMKLLDFGDRIALQKQKDISESENLRLLEAKLLDLGTGRNANQIAILDAIENERRSRGATIGVMEIELQKQQLIRQDTEATAAAARAHAAAYEAVQDQSQRAADAVEQIKQALEPLTRTEALQALEDQLETLTGWRPTEMGGISGIMESIREDLESGSEAMVANGEKAQAAMLAWISRVREMPPEMQVLTNAANRLAASFEQAFVEVFREGKFSIQSFGRAFEMTISQMAATVASRAAIFGILSQLIPGFGKTFGAGGFWGKVFGFQYGGYTGPGRPDEIKGIVHAEEVVVPLREPEKAAKWMDFIAGRLSRKDLIGYIPQIGAAGPSGGVGELRAEIVALREQIARQGPAQVHLHGNLKVDWDGLRFQIQKADARAKGRQV